MDNDVQLLTTVLKAMRAIECDGDSTLPLEKLMALYPFMDADLAKCYIRLSSDIVDAGQEEPLAHILRNEQVLQMAARRALKLKECLLQNKLENRSSPNHHASPFAMEMDEDVSVGLEQGVFYWPTSPFQGSCGYGKSKQTANGLVKPIKYHLETFQDNGSVSAQSSEHDGETPPPCRRPVMFCFPEKINWRRVTPLQMKKAALFALIQHAKTSSVAQRRDQYGGCVFFVSLQNTKFKTHFHREFANFFLTSLRGDVLPLRVHRIYCAHEPFFVSKCLWPVVLRPMLNRNEKNKLANQPSTHSDLATKTADKVVWLGHKDFYKTLHPFFTGTMGLPKSVGGYLELDAADYHKELLRVYQQR